MNIPETLYESSLSSLRLLAKGKVRDIYEIDENYMLIVTTDRLSAFDVILPEPIPGKGCVLTNVSNFWFYRTSALIANHLENIPLETVIHDADDLAQVQGRAIVVKRLTPLPIEAIVRGYLIGSGWKDYQKTGKICDLQLSEGLQQAQKLPEALYTPSSKADVGAHDENISFEHTVELLGREMAEKVRDMSLKLYKVAADYAKSCGIIIADTKFEFGVDTQNKLYLIDEVLTPDSSRFWAVEHYKVGISPPSFDKQYIRDYLETLAWDKTAPAPKLPESVRLKCAEKYREAEAKLI
ncbi:MAG: phosphoribosylaminoimidazolesuccinocarboxamide synthase [Methylococcales bacterium]|nr:phosphoribosylaminoimidazolesuccinocarboxamide synthase [Methylococcales bacterium]MCK5925428.1 phosphoribosylaminoimidazolesuccinocarboxamide synthase [Methylococcales bacterium]